MGFLEKGKRGEKKTIFYWHRYAAHNEVNLHICQIEILQLKPLVVGI
jgi:hypothetical protein